MRPTMAQRSCWLILCGAAMLAATPAWGYEPPKNVIVFVGDGMGFEAVKGAGYYYNGASGLLNFEQFPYQTRMTHNNSSGGLTDSAASGTALATGFKVNNDVISVANAAGTDPRRAIPSNGADLQTVLEYFKNQNRATGLITTSTMTDATPAAFGAHDPTRSNSAGIAADYLTASQPNLLFGGGATGFNSSATFPAIYGTPATSRTTMNALSNSATHVAGYFGSGEFAYAYDQFAGSSTFYDTNPYLSEMTSKALSILGNTTNNPNGFFLMVENEKTDSAGHSTTNDLLKSQRSVHEVGQLRDAVQQAINWVAGRTDTLIIVTADHETGNLHIAANPGAGNYYPGSSWGGSSHTQAAVPLYAWGPNAERVVGTLDNTSLSGILKATTAGPAVVTKKFQEGNGYTGTVDTHIRGASGATAYGSDTTVFTDGDDAAAPTQAMIRFENLFGSAPGQIPAGATIVSAALTLTTGTAANNESSTATGIYPMLQNWDETTTWNGMNAGISADGIEAALTRDGVLIPVNLGIESIYNVTASVQAWANGATNYGWALLPDGTNGWGFISSEGTLALRPSLEVTFIVPEPATLSLFAIAALPLTRRRRP